MSDLERRLERVGRILDDASGLSPHDDLTSTPSAPARRPWLLAVAAVLIVAIGIGALVLQSRNQPTEPADVATSATVEDQPASTVADATTNPTSPTTPAPTSEGTLPGTVAPTAPTATPTTASPGPTTTVGTAPGGALVAVPADSAAPSLTGARDDVASWALVGRFPGSDLELRGASFAPFAPGPCFAVHRSGDRSAHSWCSIEPLVPYGAVPLEDGRVAVLVDTTSSRGRITVLTSAGEVSAAGISVAVPNGEVAIAAVVVPAGVEVLRVGFGPGTCPIASLAHAVDVTGAGTVTLSGVRCVQGYAAASRYASAVVDQPDAVYLERRADGTWVVIEAGGDPCLGVAPGSSVDLSNRTPTEREQIRAREARLRAACTALGDLPAS